MSHRGEVQNAHSTKFLAYGHLGTTTYNEEDKTWETLRIIQSHVAPTCPTGTGDTGYSPFPLRHLSSRVAYDALASAQHRTGLETDYSDVDDETNGTSRRAIITAVDSKTEDDPARNDKFRPGDNFEDIEEQSPNRSALLAFGSAALTAAARDCSVRSHVPIAASAAGNNGQSVRLVRIREETTNSLDCGGGDDILRVPYISEDDQAYWSSTGGPVQQVCFAAATGFSSTWMAVRLQNCTTILHPLSHLEPVPPRSQKLQLSQLTMFSVLDANPIVTIPLSRTGGHPHADVCFHPQDHSSLALIDEHGNWSIWKVDSERQEAGDPRFRVSLMYSGKLWTWDHEKRLRASAPYHDGWHRISFCHGTGTASDELLVCNRRTAALYNTSPDLLGLIDLRLGHARDRQLILDLQWSMLVPGHCFVLTSTHLFWLCFAPQKVQNAHKHQEDPRVLLAWHHFRAHGDATLNLVLLETELTAVVLVASRLVDLVLAVRFGPLDGERHLPASLMDPLPFFVPEYPDTTRARRRPWSLLFRATGFGQDDECKGEEKKALLYKLFSLYDDLSIAEHLYTSFEPSFPPITVTNSSSNSPVPVHRSQDHLTPNSPILADPADFIVPNNWAGEDENCSRVERLRDYRRSKRKQASVPAQPSLDWRDVYAHLTDESKFPALNARTKIDALLQPLPDRLHRFKPAGMPLLSEIQTRRPQITDVDGDSQRFEDVVAIFDSLHGGDKKLERLPISLSAGKIPSRLTSIYDGIIAIHLAALSTQAPDRLRVARERLARRVTADVLFAGTAVCPARIIPSSVDEDRTVYEGTTFPSDPDSFLDPQSSPGPAFSTCAVASTAREEDPILTRLKRYATISPHTAVPPISSTNPVVSSVLRHLPISPDSNPSTYDWRVTERSIAAEQEEQIALAAQGTDPSARKRAEKIKLARARREDAKMRAAVEIASSQRAPPRILTTSQAEGGVGGMGIWTGMRQNGEGDGAIQSSQLGGRVRGVLAGSSQENGQEHGLPMVMTQPERGVFGTRTGMPGVGEGAGKRKDRGKRRAAGF